MQISTRGRYALRIMIDLALNEANKPVLRQDISYRQQISTEYVAQIFRRLCKAELVKSVKGPGGGYELARSATLIRAGDIIRAVEGPIALVKCVAPTMRPACGRINTCAAHCLWRQLSEVMENYLDSIRLIDLCEQAEKLDPESALGYQSAVDSCAVSFYQI